MIHAALVLREFGLSFIVSACRLLHENALLTTREKSFSLITNIEASSHATQILLPTAAKKIALELQMSLISATFSNVYHGISDNCSYTNKRKKKKKLTLGLYT